jgi:arylsulfatase A-like enzyme
MSLIRERYGTHRATQETWAEITATYYGMITRLDDQFGRLVEKVKALGLWDRTVTFFFTDHGEYLGDHGLIEKWPSGVSECLTHEPLIVAGAGLPRGAVFEGMAEMVDLAPTIFQLSGVGEHFPHCGRSLAGILTGQGGEGPHREYAFSEGGFLKSEEPLLERAGYPYDVKAGLQHEDTEAVGRAVACRDERWTYVYRLYEPAELYDRREDEGETRNLAGEKGYEGVRGRMEAAVLRWMVESSDFVPWVRDPRFPPVVPDKDPRVMWEKRRAEGGGGDGEGGGHDV